MSKEDIDGTVELEAHGEKYKIVFDWDALEKLQQKFTQEDLAAVASGKSNFGVLAEVLAIGLQRHHEGFTAAKVKKLSPPFVSAVNAIDRALGLAWHGSAIDDPDFGKDVEKKSTTGNRKARRATAAKTKPKKTK